MLETQTAKGSGRTFREYAPPLELVNGSERVDSE